jgi:pimeloyl-ACP methyl ester carboxylesterase
MKYKINGVNQFYFFAIKILVMKKNFLPLMLLLFGLCSCNKSNTGTTTQNQTPIVPDVKAVFINGDSLHYIDIGKGEPVVFVHGTLGDYRIWGAQMDTFALHHRVIAYSRRFAYPNKQVINDTADYTVVPHAKDLAELIRVLNLEPVHLVGHSYGAFTSLLTTINHPELIRSLTLGEPPVMSLMQDVSGGDTIRNNIITKAIMPSAKEFRNNNNEKAAALFLNGVMGDSLYFSKAPPQARDIMMINTLELRGYVLSQDFSTSITCDHLKKIKKPVLLMQGDRSPLFFTSIISQIDRCLENKEHATIANSSHGLELENPSAFNKIVLAFIENH